MRYRSVVVIVALVGCSSPQPKGEPQTPGKEAVLLEVGGLIRSYSGEAGTGPKKLADLTKYEHGYPLGLAAIRSGEVTVIWGATVAGEGVADSAPAHIVAYETSVPTSGGWVLLQNGRAKEMTADEFRAAPRAK
jgi:hypothetical protein